MSLSNDELERIRKRKEKLQKESKSASSNNDRKDDGSSASRGNTLSESELERIRKRRASGQSENSSQIVDDNYISSFFSDSQSFLTAAKTSYDKLDYNSAVAESSKSYFDDLAKRENDLRNRATTIRDYMTTNRSRFDDKSYKELASYLGIYSADSISKAFYDARDYYSQWETEDAYLDYDKKSKLDTAAAQKEIDEMESVYKKAKSISSNVGMGGQESDDYLQSQISKLLAPYGVETQTELETLLKEKKSFLAEADQLQTSIKERQAFKEKYYSLMSEPDFDKYANAGAAIENPSVTDAESDGRFLWWSWDGDEVGNIVTYSRDNADVLAMAGGNTQGNYLYRNMNDDEVKIYNYLLAKYGKEKGDEFLSEIMGELSQREGGATSDRLQAIDIPVVEQLAIGGYGLAAGVDQWASGTRQYFTDEKLPTSAMQYANADLLNSMDGLGKYAYQATNVVGNMLPSIALSKGLGALGAGVKVAKAAGAATMSIGAAGNAYADGLDYGMEPWQARTYGTLVGAAEGALEYVMGGIPALRGAEDFVGAKISLIDNALLRVGAKVGWDVVQEIGEEELQNFLEPAFRALFTGEYDAPTFEELLETAIVTAISTPAMGGVGTVVDDIRGSRAALKEYGGKTDALIQEGLESDVNTDSYKLAQKFQKQVQGTEGKAGKALTGNQIRNLLAANQEQITPKDLKKIQQATEKRLTELGETGDVSKIAELATKYATGGKLSKDEKTFLTSSKYGSRVYNELLPKNIRSGDYTTEWAEDIQTKQVNWAEYNKKEIVRRAVEAMTKGPNAYESLESRVKAEEPAKVSDTGKAEIRATGEEIDLTKPTFKKISENEVVLDVNGKSVNANDIDYDSEEQGLAINSIAKIEHITPEAAGALYDKLDMTKPVMKQLNGMDEAFSYGFYHFSEADLDAGNFVGNLTQEQKMDAYNLGKYVAKQTGTDHTDNMKNMRTAADAIAEKAAAEGKQAPKGKNLSITYNHGGGVIEDIGTALKKLGKLEKEQRGGIEAAKILHQMGIGTDFELFTSYYSKTLKDEDGNPLEVYLDDDGTEQPAYAGIHMAADGKIRINLNAYSGTKGLTLNALSHELTHFIKTWSLEKYEAMAEFLVKSYGEHGVSMNALVLKEQARLKSIRKKDVSYSEAYDEVVANAFNRMLEDGKVMERIAEIRQVDKSLADKIIEGIRKFISRFFDVYRDNKSLFKETEALMEMKEVFEQLQNMFAEALVDASDNFQAYNIPKEAFGENAELVTNAQGELLLAANESGNVLMYSEQTYLDGGRDKLEVALRQNGHTAAEIEETLSYVDDALDYIKILASGYAKTMGYTSLSDHLVADIVTNVKTGKQVMSAIVNNGDYPVNIDLSLICKKRVAYMNLMSRLIRDGIFDKVNYDGAAIAEVNEILRENGFETACLGCFVESRRLQFQTWAETIVSEWNAEVAKRNPNAKEFGFAQGKMEELTDADIDALTRELESVKKNDQGNVNLGQGNSVTRMGRLLDALPSLQKKLTVEDLLTPEGLTALRKHDGSLFSIVKSRYGAASPKIVQDFNPYASEIAMLTFAQVKGITNNAVKGAQAYVTEVKNDFAKPQKVKGESKANFDQRKKAHEQRVQDEAMRRYLYDIGGARIQSFSDFMIENIFDYIQIFADLAAKRLPLHGYTKEIVCMRLFGMTGAKWNGSLIAHVERNMGKEYAGLLPADTKDGIRVSVKGKEYVIGFDDYARNAATGGKSFIQSIGMKDVIALQLDPRYSPYVGNITIGVSDAQILAMLDSPLFRMVIPYHASGMLPIFAKLVGVDMYNDYTDYQNTTVRQYYDLDGNAVSELKNAKGETVKADTSYAFNAEIQKTKDAKKAASNYLNWCAERHPVYDGSNLVGYATFNPKFSSSPYGTDFTRHENYYKLLEDFNTYDCITEASTVQGAVTMNFPSEENRLTDQQMAEYKNALRETGIFTEKDIEKYAKKANMTFKEIIEAEVANRANYAATQAPKWEATVKAVEAKLQKEHPRGLQSSQQTDLDSDGNELSKSQQQYFADSKVRDADGHLMVMYHGTANGGAFTVFDGDQLDNAARKSQIGQGFYFTNAKEEAKSYTQNVDIYGRASKGKNPHLHQVYLNITNPFNIETDSLDIEKVKSVYMDGTYDYFFSSYIPFYLNKKTLNGKTFTKSELQEMSKAEKVSAYVDYLLSYGGSDYAKSKEVLSNMVQAFPYGKQSQLLAAMKNRLGYDGIVEEYAPGKYQYVAFSSEQIKSVENKMPTADKDIRYSSQETDFSKDFDYSELNWALDLGIITAKDKAIFERTINNEIFRGAEPQSANGEYIVDTGRCLMFTDGDFHSPTLSRVIEFATEYESLTADAKEMIIDEAKATGEVQQSIQAIEKMFGPGFVGVRNQPIGRSNGRQVRGRKGSNRNGAAQKARSLKDRLSEDGLDHLLEDNGSFLDIAYMNALNRGDMETVQQLVNDAAMDAGFARKQFHETKKENIIHVFNLGLNTNASADYGTPFGVFTKSHSRSVGLGDKQMGLFVKAKNTFRVKDRTEIAKKLPVEYSELVETISRIDSEYGPRYESLGDDVIFGFDEWLDENDPDDKMRIAWDVTRPLEEQFGDVLPEELLSIEREFHRLGEEWKAKTDQAILNAKKWITKWLRDNHYDSMELEFDNGAGNRVTDALIVLDPNQVKSADPVTYDDSGNVIPLSERFNTEKDDIRYSSQQTDNITDRDMLANAFETISRSSDEYEMIQDYKSNVELLNKLERELDDVNRQIRDIRFGTGKWDAAKLKELEAKQKQLTKEVTEYDKRLLNMEASAPLRRVIQQERKKEAERTKAHVKEIQQNKKLRAEQTELRHKIRKTVRDLDKILNRGNKKQNVKEDMKGFVSKALELADYIFTDHISNDELIRRGIDDDLIRGEREAWLVNETTEILSKLYDKADSLTDEEFTRLDAKRKANEDKLRDLLTAQRNRRLNTPVYNLFSDLVTEYASFKNSKQEAVKGAYDPKVEEFLRTYVGDADSDRAKALKNMRVADMTTDELWKLLNAYQMVLHSVRTANKLFASGNTATIEQMVTQIVSDFGSRKIPEKKLAIAAQKLSNMIGWDYEKLYYALDRIGSNAFTELIMNLANSENTVMEDVREATAFRDEIVKKYGFNNWDVNKKIDREFLDNTGKKFNMTLGQLMSLYAYSRREGAWDHIEYGGFVFGEAALTNPKPADSYKLSKEQCEAITNTLTKEQKNYVEDMQRFLSETMGEKGNEVSMLLYGIKMFNEKNYFPIHIAGQFKAQANESQAKAAEGFQSMSNAGFTHAQNPNAKAPFVLEAFNEVWSDHVNEMSRYHGTVPALEDIRRVMNRSSYSESTAESTSVKVVMENHFGKEAVKYFDNLYREANSGAINDRLQKTSKKMLSLFRKNSVAYSLSVLVQQPASIVRAYAMIDRKYFGVKGVGAITSGVTKAVFSKNKAYANAYNEMLKYAPGVTMAKEIGGFDTATGGSIRTHLLDTQKSFKQKMKTENALGKGKAVLDLVDDNAIANLPNVADKIAWIEIWNACKRETVAKHKDLTPGSDEFMKAVGERFTEVIRATQVYDSIFAKSPMLKSKNLAVQYLVSFMNEPNTVANMAESAVRNAMRGDWKQGARTAHVLIHSIIFTGVMKSLIYAMRDDDEDETYIEKYIESLAGSLLDDFWFLNYIPIARDVWSIAQGYDVERADMAIVSDAIGALNKVIKAASTERDDLTEDELIELDKKQTEANWQLVEALSAFFGIPVKNIRREIEAMIDHARIAKANAGKTTAMSTWDTLYEAVSSSIPFMSGGKNKQDKIYEAIIRGDKQYVARLKATYKTEDAYHTAVRKALRENDPRIREAALAQINGNPSERVRIAKQIIADMGKEYFNDVITAINSEINAMTPGDDTSAKKEKGFYTVEDFVREVTNGDHTAASAAKQDVIDTAKKNGKTEEEAEKSFASSVKTEMKKRFLAGTITEDQVTDTLIDYCGESYEDAEEYAGQWAFEKEYGFTYSDRADAYKSGAISAAELRDFLVDVGGMTAEDAMWQVKVYDWQKEGFDTDSKTVVKDYETFCKPAGINKNTYFNAYLFYEDSGEKGVTNSKIKECMPYIDRLPLTSYQKTELAKCWWAESTVNKYKTW